MPPSAAAPESGAARATGRVLVRLSGVSKFFGPKLVFKNVSLDVEPGRIWLVVGPNGAGKSTLLNIMAGLHKPTSGSVERNVGEGRMAYLGHNTFLYARLSARENLEFWARMYGLTLTAEQIDVALARVGLSKAAEELAGRFSRGMAQRLSLARVLLVEPALIFLDEPGTGLDARSGKILRDEILAARDRGASVLWVSHQVREDLALADDVLYLEGRRPAYAGPAAGFIPQGDIC